MKLEFENPMFEVISFGKCDIVTTSGGDGTGIDMPTLNPKPDSKVF